MALPTETVYGLAARADSDEAVAAIYRAKGRPSFNPLIVHIPNAQETKKYTHVNFNIERLTEHFWPGPLTLVLPKRETAPLAVAVTAGLPSVALRCPAHPVMQAVLRECGLPLAAPSANVSGGVSPTSAAHVAASLGDKADLILDGGECEAGIESTIAAVREDGSWQILRPGPISQSAIAEVLGRRSENIAPSGKVEAPGQLASHYAPGKPVRLNAEAAEVGEFHIGYGEISGDMNLSPSADLAEAASRLYAALHQAAAAQHPRIAVAPIPAEGIGIAINDRLKRAAA